ncbi:hypothetical protein GUJ93_ZPchr0007g4449 [Zizania palustris]|uniref:Uncharacterized protein n=1 Tax=Zizania palustris TaxID=103762 RepID=A0A8J5VY69_ZIZPA|nr:hypothetical protein GUJ93_ZPchr0007g4449 [Zizania palustris]
MEPYGCPMDNRLSPEARRDAPRAPANVAPPRLATPVTPRLPHAPMTPRLPRPLVNPVVGEGGAAWARHRRGQGAACRGAFQM